VESFDDSLEYHYFTALHWALAQVSPGNIDIMPMNWRERVMNIFVLCLTLIIFSSFISSMTVAVTRLRNLNSADDKRFALLRKYFKDHNISGDLALRVHSFLEEKHTVQAGKTHEREVDLISHLTKGLHSEIVREIKEPTLRRYPVLRQLHSSEAANDMIALICSEACSHKHFGPGEKVYVVDEASRGMYFLTHGKYELREYLDDEVESFMICAPPPHASVSKSPSKQGRVSAISPATELTHTTVAWLSEFALFWQRSHDTMLIAESYCETLQVNRQAFSAVMRQFPFLQESLMEANQSRHDHAVLMMESESAVGDWIRPRNCYKSSRGWNGEWQGVVPSEASKKVGVSVEAARKTASSKYAGESWNRGSSAPGA
jgi:hypothetical protein